MASFTRAQVFFFKGIDKMIDNEGLTDEEYLTLDREITDNTGHYA